MRSWTFQAVAVWLKHATFAESELRFVTARETYIIDDVVMHENQASGIRDGTRTILYRWWLHATPDRVIVDSLRRPDDTIFLRQARIDFAPWKTAGPRLVARTEGKKEFLHIENDP